MASATMSKAVDWRVVGRFSSDKTAAHDATDADLPRYNTAHDGINIDSTQRNGTGPPIKKAEISADTPHQLL